MAKNINIAHSYTQVSMFQRHGLLCIEELKVSQKLVHLVKSLLNFFINNLESFT